MDRALKDKLAIVCVYISVCMTLGLLLWILGYVVINGIGDISIEFLTQNPKGDEGGILPMILNTIYMIGISVAISAPIGIGAAIYLTEYANPGRLVSIIRLATESLAGIPSIVFGLFGMMFFVTYLKFGWSLLSGALTLGIMVLPTIERTTEEALKAVPKSFREGSLALGVSKLRTIFRVVLPSALPGIFTAIILSIGRIVGETAAVYFTAGMVPRLAKSIMNSGRTLSVHMYLLAKEGISFEKAYATGTVLIVVVLVINMLANKISKQLVKA